MVTQKHIKSTKSLAGFVLFVYLCSNWTAPSNLKASFHCARLHYLCIKMCVLRQNEAWYWLYLIDFCRNPYSNRKGAIMKQNMKRLPYGINDFEAVIEQNQCYVDKTMYLPLLEKVQRSIKSSCSLLLASWWEWRKCLLPSSYFE